jgi:hypothetical protein
MLISNAMAARRRLYKRGDPEEPFTRRPDSCYLGNFTSCFFVFGAAGQVCSLAGRAGRLVFGSAPPVQVAYLQRVTGGAMQTVSALAGLNSDQRHGPSTNSWAENPFLFGYTDRKRPGFLRTGSLRGLHTAALIS